MTDASLSPLKQAFLALQHAEARIGELEAEKSEPIAIIGLGCRMPGTSEASVDSFWDLLTGSRDATTEGLTKRWRETGAGAEGIPEHVRHAALLDTPDRFDAAFFGISPREAASMDPQQRLVLEVTWEALEHAGIAPTSLYGSSSGVYLGICTYDYPLLQLGSHSQIDGHFGSGAAHSVASGRINYVLGLCGPSLSVDTACSSSLVAIHLASEALRRGECRLALAGGVNLILSTEASRTFGEAGMLASDGRCKAFSAAADGFVRGEGCGVVVLKRLRDATADGDRVLAVIRGSAVNHDGPSSGLTVPNGLAQQALMRQALRAAGVDASEVSYVEAHGTGTTLGDPIEAEALGAVLGGAARRPDEPLLIGSVKTNIGHLEAAAGVAGLIKVVLALQHKVLPGQLYAEVPSPHIRWDALRLRVADATRPWRPINGRWIAGVSGFGFSGTNAHVVLEAAADATAVSQPRPQEILPLAARTEPALHALAARYLERLERGPAADWADLCHTAAVGRAAFPRRLSVRAADAATAAVALRAFLAGTPHPALLSGHGGRPRVAFLFTGQGSQHAGMGRGLYATSPLFRAIVERAEATLADRPAAERLAVPLGAVMRGEHPEAAALLEQTLYTQPALYVLEYALAELWRGLGVEPAAVLGHSLGEYVGCAVAGVFSFEDGLRLVADRARLMHGLAADGAMLVVAASEAEVAELLRGREAEVALAGVNGPRQVTVSGARGAVEAIAQGCAARGWRTQRLPVSQAFHSPLIEPIEAALEARAGMLAYAAPRLPVISNLTGEMLPAASAAYWRAHLRQPVRFAQGLATLRGLGCDVLIELGPRPVLIQLARQEAPSDGPARHYLASLKGTGVDEWDAFCQAVQGLYAAGAELDWAGWSRGYGRRKVDAPSYPFERQRHWIAVGEGPARVPVAAPSAGAAHPLLGTRLRSALEGGQFEADLGASGAIGWLSDHRIGGQAIMPATGLMEMMLAAGAALDRRWQVLEELSIVAPLRLPATGGRTVQTVVDAPRDGTARVRVFAAAADAAGVEAPPDEQGQLAFRLHAEARLAPPGDGACAADDLAAVRARCERPIEAEAHYRALAGHGADFGPGFRGVRRLHRGMREALAEITAPLPALVADRLHPATLDACLQTAAALIGEGDESFLPTSLRRFECRSAHWPEQLIAHARMVGLDPRAPEIDFTIRDTGGVVLAQLERLRFQSTANTHRPDIQEWMYELAWRETAASDPAPNIPAWVVVGSGTLANAVAASLRASGHFSTLCAPADGELEQAVTELRRPLGVVYVPPDLSEHDPESARPGLEQLLSLSRSHAQRAVLADARLYIVTRKVHAVRLDEATILTDAAISGLAATLFNEFPELRCTRIDVDPDDPPQAGADIAREALADTTDDWVAYREARRFVARLVRAQPVAADQGPVRLVSDQGLSGLHWQPCGATPPGPHELEIEVRAAALNFRDVVSLVGLVADQTPLGGECAGVVTRVGSGVVRFRPGDEVVALTPGSFASFALAHQDLTIRKPAELSFEAAAAQGLVYLTADYCLNTVARMRPGERVLIHAAAGGVGLAAVQLCQRAGLEIYATAGSAAKQAHLRALGVEHVFSSRSLDFAQEIDRVDIVLNSLAGQFVDAGLSLLGPGGRFVEIGKTDVRQPEAVAGARPGVTYTAVDLTDHLREKPDAAVARMEALFREMIAGDILPVPHRAYEFADAEVAFRDLASARNIGKLVLTQLRPDHRPPLVRRDGAYIVTGGLTGIGLRTAQWLAEQGASRVMLIGRRPPAPEVSDKIAQWRATGVDVVTVAGDVGEYAVVAAAVADAGAALRGVIHCANVLDDAPAGELTWDRFDTVMRPKAQGAWNLHRATAGVALDFFVMFSSMAALAGTRGGANYASANIALDSLAHLRRHHGLPALSIDWGAWAEIGWAARTAGGGTVRPGFAAMRPDLGIEAMARAMQLARKPQLAIASIDWPVLIDAAGHHAASSLWADFMAGSGQRRDRETAPALPSLAELMADCPAAELHAEVVAHLQILAAKALGFDDPARIDPDCPLQDMGMDSIVAVDLRNTLARSLDVEVAATVLFDYPTLSGLADHSIDLCLSRHQPAFTDGPSEDGDLLALIEGLTDEEANERLLAKTTEKVL